MNKIDINFIRLFDCLGYCSKKIGEKKINSSDDWLLLYNVYIVMRRSPKIFNTYRRSLAVLYVDYMTM